MAVVLNRRDSSRRARRVDATATPAAANAPRSRTAANEIDDLIDTAHSARQAWDALKAASELAQPNWAPCPRTRQGRSLTS